MVLAWEAYDAECPEQGATFLAAARENGVRMYDQDAVGVCAEHLLDHAADWLLETAPALGLAHDPITWALDLARRKRFDESLRFLELVEPERRRGWLARVAEEMLAHGEAERAERLLSELPDEERLWMWSHRLHDLMHRGKDVEALRLLDEMPYPDRREEMLLDAGRCSASPLVIDAVPNTTTRLWMRLTRIRRDPSQVDASLRDWRTLGASEQAHFAPLIFRALTEAGRAEEATAMLPEVEGRDRAEDRLALAEGLAALGRHEAAARVLEDVLALLGGMERDEARRLRDRVLGVQVELEDVAGAEESFRWLRDNGQGICVTDPVEARLGDLLARQGRWDEARPWPGALPVVAARRMEAGDAEGAMRLFTEARERILGLEDVERRVALARALVEALQRLGLRDEAVGVVRALVSNVDPSDLSFNFRSEMGRFAEILVAAGDMAGGLRLVDCRHDPEVLGTCAFLARDLREKVPDSVLRDILAWGLGRDRLQVRDAAMPVEPPPPIRGAVAFWVGPEERHEAVDPSDPQALGVAGRLLRGEDVSLAEVLAVPEGALRGAALMLLAERVPSLAVEALAPVGSAEAQADALVDMGRRSAQGDLLAAARDRVRAIPGSAGRGRILGQLAGLIARGEWREPVLLGEVVDEVLAEAEVESDVCFRLAADCVEAGDEASASRCLRRALERADPTRKSLVEHALRQLEAGEAQAAIRFSAHFGGLGFELDRPYDRALQGLGRAAMEQGDLDTALAVVGRLDNRTLQREMVLWQLLPVLVRGGRADEALDLMRVDGGLRLNGLGDVAVALAEVGRGVDAVRLIAQVPAEYESQMPEVMQALAARGDGESLKGMALVCCDRPAMIGPFVDALARVYPEHAEAIRAAR